MDINVHLDTDKHALISIASKSGEMHLIFVDEFEPGIITLNVNPDGGNKRFPSVPPVTLTIGHKLEV